jgi:arylsulfatase A
MKRSKCSCSNAIKIYPALLFFICLMISLAGCKKQTGFSSIPLPPGPPPDKPNIILILADDYGYEVPAFDGGQSYQTPNLDQMAQHGLRFTQCHSTALCSPSRFMLLTGKYNFRNYTAWGRMDTGQRTFANMLRDAGYATCIAGKWQLNGGNDTIKTLGFDNYLVWEILGSDDDEGKGSRYKSPNLYENGQYLPGDSMNNKYGEDIFTNYILNFIQENYDKKKPFLVYYPVCLTHAPFCPTPDDPEFAGWDPNNLVGDPKFFPSMANYMDQKVGQIVSKLKSLDIEKNSIILFSGDNGTSVQITSRFNGYDIQGGKGHTTEYGTHVPLVAYAPGFIINSTNNDLIDFTDFHPTLADLAHIPMPETYGVLDGVSFYPRLIGQAGTPRDWIFCHYDPHPERHNSTVKRYVQNTHYKYYEDGRFYDIISDIMERNPIPDAALTPEEKQAKQQFQNVLNEMHK